MSSPPPSVVRWPVERARKGRATMPEGVQNNLGSPSKKRRRRSFPNTPAGFASSSLSPFEITMRRKRPRYSMFGASTSLKGPSLEDKCHIMISTASEVLQFYQTVFDRLNGGNLGDLQWELQRCWKPFEAYKNNQISAPSRHIRNAHFLEIDSLLQAHDVRPDSHIWTLFTRTIEIINHATFVHYIYQIPQLPEGTPPLHHEEMTTDNLLRSFEAGESWPIRQISELIDARRAFWRYIVPRCEHEIHISDDEMMLFLDLSRQILLLFMSQSFKGPEHKKKLADRRKALFDAEKFGQILRELYSPLDSEKSLAIDQAVESFEVLASECLQEIDELSNNVAEIQLRYPFALMAADLVSYVSYLTDLDDGEVEEREHIFSSTLQFRIQQLLEGEPDDESSAEEDMSHSPTNKRSRGSNAALEKPPQKRFGEEAMSSTQAAESWRRSSALLRNLADKRSFENNRSRHHHSAVGKESTFVNSGKSDRQYRRENDSYDNHERKLPKVLSRSTPANTDGHPHTRRRITELEEARSFWGPVQRVVETEFDEGNSDVFLESEWQKRAKKGKILAKKIENQNFHGHIPSQTKMVSEHDTTLMDTEVPYEQESRSSPAILRSLRSSRKARKVPAQDEPVTASGDGDFEDDFETNSMEGQVTKQMATTCDESEVDELSPSQSTIYSEIKETPTTFEGPSQHSTERSKEIAKQGSYSQRCYSQSSSSHRYFTGANIFGRRFWTEEETRCLISCLEDLAQESTKGRISPNIYATVLSRHGPNGSISRTLSQRNNLQLKDKARTELQRMQRNGDPTPLWASLFLPRLVG